MALTDTKVRNQKPGAKPIKLTDAGGLYLEVRPTGKRLWRYRYRIAGKENVFAIGEYMTDKSHPEHISLQGARTLRDEARTLVKQGVHPAHKRQAEVKEKIDANQNTFRAVASAWFEDRLKKKGWTSYYANQITKTLESDVYPYIGNLPVGLVEPDHIEAILDRILERGANTIAVLVRQWCSAVFRYAIRKRLRKDDPTAAFAGEVERRPVRHNPALPVKELPVLLRQFDGYRSRATAIALNLLLLTLARTKELREASWSEFDLDKGVWRVPAQRMKMRREHLVPLSKQAVALLRELNEMTGRWELLFPNERDASRAISATTLNRALEYLGYAGRFSCHGFRSTGSTILNGQGYRRDVIEMALAHSEKDFSRKAYNQADYLSERRVMLQDWADFLDALKSGAKVVPFRKTGSEV